MKTFKEELEDLCHKHGVQLSTSGYDSITVEHKGEDSEAIYGGYIDITEVVTDE